MHMHMHAPITHRRSGERDMTDQSQKAKTEMKQTRRDSWALLRVEAGQDRKAGRAGVEV